MFWNKFTILCAKKGIRPNPAATEMGISSGTVTRWKQGFEPSPESVKKVSEYFDVPVEYLLADATENSKDQDAFEFFQEHLEDEGYTIEPNLEETVSGQEWFVSSPDGVWFYVGDQTLREKYREIQEHSQSIAFHAWLIKQTAPRLSTEEQNLIDMYEDLPRGKQHEFIAEAARFCQSLAAGTESRESQKAIG